MGALFATLMTGIALVVVGAWVLAIEWKVTRTASTKSTTSATRVLPARFAPGLHSARFGPRRSRATGVTERGTDVLRVVGLFPCPSEEQFYDLYVAPDSVQLRMSFIHAHPAEA